MTEPSQYFKGRTVQEQMNEVIGYVDVRSAEVATDAIAADVAAVHQDKLDADAYATAAAASAAAAAGTLANAVKKTGEASQSIAGDIAVAGDLSGGTVTVPTPVNNTDAASKKYVDDADALKADKTYVDAQDALKINITDINSYAVGLTGNQTGSGTKTWTGQHNFNQDIIRRSVNVHNLIRDEVNDKKVADGTVWYSGRIRYYDQDGTEFGRIFFRVNADGTSTLGCEVRNSNGTFKFVALANGDVI